MNAYIVRLKENHELVGIFVCEWSALYEAVDECTNAERCEAAIIGEGGVMWLNKTANVVPASKDHAHDDDTPTINFDGATPSESWSDRVWTGRFNWRPVTPVTEMAKGLRSLNQLLEVGDPQ